MTEKGDKSFTAWKKHVETRYPRKTVTYDQDDCLYNEGHTYAALESPYQAYNFYEHPTLEEAVAFSRRPIKEYNEHETHFWRQLSWEELLYDVFGLNEPIEESVETQCDDKAPVKLLEPDEFWKFYEHKMLLKRIFGLGYLGNGTWEHSHVCLVFEIDSKYCTLRIDINGTDIVADAGREIGD